MAVRLADLLAGLSRLADLGFGLEAGEAVRSAALATTLGRALDLAEDDIRAGMYTALLHHVGCTGVASEAARTFNDEFVLNVATARSNLAKPTDMFTTFLPMLTQGQPPFERARLVLNTLAKGKRHGETTMVAVCEVGREAARRLRLPTAVQDSVYSSYEWWNGKGLPGGLAGEAIPVGARLAHLTSTAALFDGVGGADLAVEAVCGRAGTMLDPEMADAFATRAGALLAELNATDPQALVLEAEPRPAVAVPDGNLDEVAAVFADLADVKTPHTHGHSRGVAAFARAAGERLGLEPTAVADLEVAGLLHDLGRVAVSSAVWDKPSALSAHEWEQVRLHAYHSERVLAGSERLAPLARLVGMHHERLDGDGYHRGATSAELDMPARVLAAADAYQAMTQERPHRAARTPEQAEAQLLDDAKRGALDGEAVEAVLTAAGHDVVPVGREPPAGLTDREVEVLGLVAEGCTNAEIASRLVISRRTAEHHVQHIYSKIGVSSRAAAAMFALEHELLVPTLVSKGR